MSFKHFKINVVICTANITTKLANDYITTVNEFNYVMQFC